MKQTEDKLLLLIIIIVILMLIRMDAQDLSNEANLTDEVYHVEQMYNILNLDSLRAEFQELDRQRFQIRSSGWTGELRLPQRLGSLKDATYGRCGMDKSQEPSIRDFHSADHRQ